MPFKQKSDGSIAFIRLPVGKYVYGTEKGEEGKRYLYVRRFDASGLRVDSAKGFASSLFDILENNTFANDWIIPIKSREDINFDKLCQHPGPNVDKLLALHVSSRPWFSIIHTPNDVIYFIKTRFSASTALQAAGLAASLFNPAAAAGAIGWFARKQELKYQLAKGRGEKNPGIIPKIFVSKIWQVSITGDIEQAYRNIALIVESGNAWNEW